LQSDFDQLYGDGTDENPGLESQMLEYRADLKVLNAKSAEADAAVAEAERIAREA